MSATVPVHVWRITTSAAVGKKGRAAVALTAAAQLGAEGGRYAGPARTAGASSRRLDPDTLGDHVDRLFRAARAICGSREEAEDLVQETFARVLAKPRWLHSEDDIGYLLRVLRNTFVSGRRVANRRPQVSTALDDLTGIEDMSAPRPEASMDSGALYQAIASLPDGFRDALIAIDVMGLSYREASRALRVREGTVTTRLHRARQRVADRLADGEGINPAVQPRTLPRPTY